ncbi:hypothetical protein [Polyangium fumosum]|uniref:Uncharacterized protein n=1 Tax=Polyangium fumosum TaxID=889272 RepID=A0A4U1J0C3_9BACT|nr:hypothetical protein [Polyangium fumosum]TKD00417.1 hypothetical protein E8A74_34550 [Polyangium fumosum]
MARTKQRSLFDVATLAGQAPGIAPAPIRPTPPALPAVRGAPKRRRRAGAREAVPALARRARALRGSPEALARRGDRQASRSLLATCERERAALRAELAKHKGHVCSCKTTTPEPSGGPRARPPEPSAEPHAWEWTSTPAGPVPARAGRLLTPLEVLARVPAASLSEARAARLRDSLSRGSQPKVEIEFDAEGGLRVLEGAGVLGVARELQVPHLWAEWKRAARSSGRPRGRPKKEPAAPPSRRLPTDDTAFADRVLSAARASKTGRFGENKVFVSHVIRQLEREGFTIGDVDTFKARLVAAHRARLLALSRADLVQAMDPADVAESEIVHLNGSFHFVRIL